MKAIFKIGFRFEVSGLRLFDLKPLTSNLSPLFLLCVNITYSYLP